MLRWVCWPWKWCCRRIDELMLFPEIRRQASREEVADVAIAIHKAIDWAWRGEEAKP